MVPHQGRAIDTVNFRNVKESCSLELGSGASKLKGVPMDSGLATPSGEQVPDPFEDFNSVTLHHDGDEHVPMIDDSVGLNYRS
jgi:protein-serine/threonine kinase